MASNSHQSWWEEASSKKDELVFAVLAVSVVTLAILWYKRAISSSPNGTPPLPPGPYGLPVVGYLPFLGPKLHEELTKVAHHYGPIFKLHLGSKLFIVVNSPNLAEVVTSKQDEIFSNRDQIIAGLTVSYGANDIAWSNKNASWRNLRRVFVHEVVSSMNLEASHTYRQGEVRKTIKYVYDMIGRKVDINEISFLTALSVLISMVWGKSLVEGVKGSNVGAKIREVVSGIIELAGVLNMSDFFPILARFDFQGVERGMKRQVMQFDQIFERTVEERINSKSTDREEALEQEGRKDLLQILLELKEQNTGTSLNMTQIKALVMDILLGGTDTTSTIIEWTMTEILRNPKVKKLVQEELSEIVGLTNIVEESHLPKLKYLDAVVKETFRLHPPLPFLLARSPSQSCTVGGYTVPKGAAIFLNVWAIQRDPRHWHNPSEFDPERFLNYEGSNKWDYHGTSSKFFPFGSGRRWCPGVPLAEKMLMHILASLLHSFDWSLPTGEQHDLSEKFGIALKKRKPLVVVPSQRLPHVSLYM